MFDPSATASLKCKDVILVSCLLLNATLDKKTNLCNFAVADFVLRINEIDAFEINESGDDSSILLTSLLDKIQPFSIHSEATT